MANGSLCCSSIACSVGVFLFKVKERSKEFKEFVLVELCRNWHWQHSVQKIPSTTRSAFLFTCTLKHFSWWLNYLYRATQSTWYLSGKKAGRQPRHSYSYVQLTHRPLRPASFVDDFYRHDFRRPSFLFCLDFRKEMNTLYATERKKWCLLGFQWLWS